jgi:hypothetical protein
MKQVTEKEKEQIAEYIHGFILDNFEDQGQVEELALDEGFQFRKHPFVIIAHGEYEAKDADFGQDEIPDYKVKVWLTLVEVHSAETDEGHYLDEKEIEAIINNIG